MSEKKVINKRISGFLICLLIMLIFSLFWFMFDETVLAIICFFISLFQLIFILTTPYCYIFSEKQLTIKYCFGLKEIIHWQDIRTIVNVNEYIFRYTTLNAYKIYYFSNKKHSFFMQGIISKTKVTTELMKKYCPTKIPR